MNGLLENVEPGPVPVRRRPPTEIISLTRDFDFQEGRECHAGNGW